MALKRFTVDEYHRMISAGVFRDNEPVELLEGWIVGQMGHNPPHDVAVKLASQLLDRALPPDWHTRVQSAITTGDSEPLPDIAVVRGSARTYLTAHPGPGDIALLVEVSDASLDRDRNEKTPVYARAGVPAYWIVNLQAGVVEVFTDPTGPTASPRYRSTTVLSTGDLLPLNVPGVSHPPLPVRDLLP